MPTAERVDRHALRHPTGNKHSLAKETGNYSVQSDDREVTTDEVSGSGREQRGTACVPR